MKKLFIFLILVLFCTTAHAANVRLVWDLPVGDQDTLTHGYRVYAHIEGAEYDLAAPSKWGWKGQLCNETECSIIFEDVTETMYFVATAFNENQESAISNEAVYTWVEPEPTLDPITIRIDTAVGSRMQVSDNWYLVTKDGLMPSH